MKRFHLFEIHDQEWCPRAIRDAETDYLQFVIGKMKGYAAVVPVLATALQRTATRQVLDLCSGAGGPWFWLQPVLAERGLDVSVCLTDKYPNLEALGTSSALNLPPGAISYHPEPVDVTGVPHELAGFRTLFSAFHHFRPAQARAMLGDAVRKRHGIAIFEGTYHSALAMFLMLLVPLMVLLVTPFIRPFRWSRLFWTYLVPVVPLVSLFDGLVSCLRTYSVQELRQLTEDLGANNYQWDFGELKGVGPVPITYLIGVPIEETP
jgi:hypothetical protein